MTPALEDDHSAVDEHQRKMWQEMTRRIDAYEAGEVDLGSLVADVRGLFIEADPHDVTVRDDFELFWAPIDAQLELRTEPWAPPGSPSDAALSDSVAAFRRWVRTVVDADATDTHR